MRQALQQNRPRVRVSNSVPIPAPFAGLNTRDALSALQPQFAPLMVNWFPGTSDLTVRRGHAAHATGLDARVDTLATYSTPAGTTKMYAVTSGKIYDVTSSGAVGAAAVSSLSNSRFQWTNFTVSGGTSYLCMFNGADGPQYWDNSSWTTITGASSPAITGVTPSNLINCSVHKRRMWLVEINTLKAWYLPVDSVGGAANAIDLAGVATEGGYLMATGTWTRDGGDGIDDIWVAVTSEGEVILYQGTDPTSASTWQLVGKWKVGRPIGRRCLVAFKGDLLIMTVDGIVPVSRLAQMDANAMLSAPISTSWIYASETYFGNYGWQILYYPNGEQLIVNVPNGDGSDQTQFVMNSTTGAWTTYEDLEFNCMVLHNGTLYGGGSTVVDKLWSGYTAKGSDIVAEAQQAFSHMGQQGLVKRFLMARPALLSNGTPVVTMDMNVDYDIIAPTDPVGLSELSGDLWDTGVWDTAIWTGSALEVRLPWVTTSAVGLVGGIAIKVSTNGAQVRWTATDVVFEPGNVTVTAA